MRIIPVHFAVGAACLVLFCRTTAAQPSVSDSARIRTVFSVNGRGVGIEEFEARLNLFSVGFPQDAVQRKQFVALSLIQEKVLALAAREAHLDTMGQVNAAIRQMEKEAVYEEWMNREVRAAVTISDDEIRRVYPLYRQQRVFEYRTFRDSVFARKAERGFRRLRARGASAADTVTQTKVLDYGETYRLPEETLFSMNAGETRLMPIDGTWYLFYLKTIQPHPARSQQNFPESYPAVAKLVRTRKEQAMLAKKMAIVLAERSFTVTRQAREQLFNLLAERIPFSNPSITKFPELVNQEITKRFPPAADLRETFLTFRDGSTMTLGQLWTALSSGPYLLNYRSREELRGGLDYLIRRLVIVESVTASAYRLGLQRTPYVAEQTAMWADNLLSNLYQYRLSEQQAPTDEELRTAARTFTGTPADIRQRVLQQKTHAAIDRLLDERIGRTSVTLDTAALSRSHALEGALVVRKEHFPNRYAVPLLIPANPEAAWSRQLLRSWGVH